MTDTRPVVLKAEHLGITFGGLKAVSDFNMDMRKNWNRLHLRKKR